MTMRFGFLGFFIALFLLLIGCQRQGGDTANRSSPNTTTTSPTTTASNTIGVPECDDYLRKYEACLNKHVPEADRVRLRQALDQTRAAWRDTLNTAGARDTLVNTCKQMTETARTSMVTYGCTDF